MLLLPLNFRLSRRFLLFAAWHCGLLHFHISFVLAIVVDNANDMRDRMDLFGHMSLSTMIFLEELWLRGTESG